MSGTKGLLDRGGVKAVWPEAPGFWRGWLCHSPCSQKEIMQTLHPVKNQSKLGAFEQQRLFFSLTVLEARSPKSRCHRPCSL